MDEQADIPETDAENGGFDRRKLLRGAAMAGAAAWVVPSVISLTASPALASGRFLTSQGANQPDAGVDNVLEVTINGGGVLIAVVVLNADNQTINPPPGDGWTLVYQEGTTAATDKLTVAVFKRFSATATTTNRQFSWTDQCPALLTISRFPGATTVETFSDSGLTTSTAMTAPSITIGSTGGNPLFNRGVLYVGGYFKVGQTNPTFVGPSGFSSRQDIGNTVIGTAQYTAPFPFTPATGGTFPATSATLSSAQLYNAGLLSIY